MATQARGKPLAQVFLTTTALTDMAGPAASKYWNCTGLFICNQTGVATSFRVAVAVAALADTPKQYIYYDVPIPENDTFLATTGLELDATDIPRVKAAIANSLSVSLYGFEISY